MLSKPKVAVTGHKGLIGWHFRAATKAVFGEAAYPLELRSDESIEGFRASDETESVAIFHCAGRVKGSDDEVWFENIHAAERLASLLGHVNGEITVIFAGTTKAHDLSTYGKAKRQGFEILHESSVRHGFRLVNVELPNVFGEHAAPNYNSVVATACHYIRLGQGFTPRDNRMMELAHAQDVADYVIDIIRNPLSDRQLVTFPMSVHAVVAKIEELHESYRNGNFPKIESHADRSLFNTYRSMAHPSQNVFEVKRVRDSRGFLSECADGMSSPFHFFVSTTRPKSRRGRHFHRRTVERFTVLSGEGVVRLRKLFTSTVVEISFGGGKQISIDIPTLWSHELVNLGRADLLVAFFNDAPNDFQFDTFPESV